VDGCAVGGEGIGRHSAADSDRHALLAHHARIAAGSSAIAVAGFLYFGIAQVVLPARVPAWFPGQRVVGVAIIAVGGAMMAWPRLHFRSWRFRAKLDGRGFEATV